MSYSFQILAKLSNVKYWKEVRTLRGAAEAIGKDCKAMVEVVKELLPDAVYTREAIEKILDMSDKEFEEGLPSNTKNSRWFMKNLS